MSQPVTGHAVASCHYRLVREGTGRHPRPLADLTVSIRLAAIDAGWGNGVRRECWGLEPVGHRITPVGDRSVGAHPSDGRLSGGAARTGGPPTPSRGVGPAGATMGHRGRSLNPTPTSRGRGRGLVAPPRHPGRPDAPSTRTVGLCWPSGAAPRSIRPDRGQSGRDDALLCHSVATRRFAPTV